MLEQDTAKAGQQADRVIRVGVDIRGEPANIREQDNAVVQLRLDVLVLKARKPWHVRRLLRGRAGMIRRWFVRTIVGFAVVAHIWLWFCFALRAGHLSRFGTVPGPLRFCSLQHWLLKRSLCQDRPMAKAWEVS